MRKYLPKYADLIVKFALNSGKGLKKGEVVIVVVPDVAKPFLFELQRAILESGGHPILRLVPTGGFDRQTYELSSEEQLKFFPKEYKKALIDTIDHQIGILAETDLEELKGIDPKKIMMSTIARKKTREWLFDKEYKGKLTWSLALYPTEAQARESGMSLEEYSQEVIKACYLDKKDPIKEWKRIFRELGRTQRALDKLGIERLHIKGEKIDLTVKIGEKRKWLGGKGRNIPSYEVFTTPDWRGTEGYIYFNEPLYTSGNKIEGIYLEFKKGKVVKFDAKKGKKFLKKLLEVENANKLGEFSLTDKNFSRVTKFMANTLYDENVGGKYGNMHVALGTSYREAYSRDVAKVSKTELKKLGFNESPKHQDIINTQRKTVTATLKGGRTKVIYEDGEFLV